MVSQRLTMALPYAALLAIAAWFFHLAGQIQYTPRDNNLGPDFLPRLGLGFMMLVFPVQSQPLLSPRSTRVTSIVNIRMVRGK